MKAKIQKFLIHVLTSFIDELVKWVAIAYAWYWVFSDLIDAITAKLS